MSLRGYVLWGVVLLTGAPLGQVFAQGSPKSTAPVPPAVGVSTNTPTRKDPLKALEEQLTKSFQSFAPNNSLDGMMAPPPVPVPRPVVPNKRVLELLEKRRNALQLNPEDLVSRPGESELFETPSFDQKRGNAKKANDLDQFYENLERRRALGKSLGITDAEMRSLDKQGTAPTRVQPDSTEDANMPGSIADVTQKLRKLLGTETDAAVGSSSAPRPNYYELFGLGTGPTTEKSLGPTPFIEQYKDWLNTPATAGSASSLNALAAPEQTPVATYNPMESGLGSSRGGGAGQLGAINPILSPTAPQDITAKVVNDWNPFYSSSAAVAPKLGAQSYIPPKPNFDAPRRKF
jgi:hypothetical protein